MPYQNACYRLTSRVAFIVGCSSGSVLRWRPAINFGVVQFGHKQSTHLSRNRTWISHVTCCWQFNTSAWEGRSDDCGIRTRQIPTPRFCHHGLRGLYESISSRMERIHERTGYLQLMSVFLGLLRLGYERHSI